MQITPRISVYLNAHLNLTTTQIIMFVYSIVLIHYTMLILTQDSVYPDVQTSQHITVMPTHTQADV